MAPDDGAACVYEATLLEIGETGIDVLELRAADVSDQGVPPVAAVARRASIVDEPHDEAGIDVRLDLGLPPVHVEGGRSAVDEHDRGERPARVVGRDEEAVHAVAALAREVPRLVLARRDAARSL